LRQKKKDFRRRKDKSTDFADSADFSESSRERESFHESGRGLGGKRQDVMVAGW